MSKKKNYLAPLVRRNAMKIRINKGREDSELDKIRLGFEITHLNWLSVKAPEKLPGIRIRSVTLLVALIAAN